MTILLLATALAAQTPPGRAEAEFQRRYDAMAQRYEAARQLFEDWQRGTALETSRREAQAIFLEVERESRELLASAEEMMDDVALESEEDDLFEDRRFAWWVDKVAYLRYVQGWTAYSLGSCAEDPAAAAAYHEEAIERLAPFLHESMDIELVRRAILGLALAYAGRGYVEELSRLCDEMPFHEWDPGMYRQLASVRVQALARLHRHIEVARAAATLARRLPEGSQLTTVDAEVMLAGVQALAILAETASAHRDRYRQEAQALAQRLQGLNQEWKERVEHLLMTQEEAVRLPMGALLRARQLHDRGDFVKAVELCREGLREQREGDERSPRGMLMEILAASLERTDQNVEAISAYRELLRAFPASERVAYWAERTLFAAVRRFQADKAPAALSGLEEVCALLREAVPDHPEVRNLDWYVGRAYSVLEEWEKARETLARVPPDSDFRLDATTTALRAAFCEANAAREGGDTGAARSLLVETIEGVRELHASFTPERPVPDGVAGTLADLAIHAFEMSQDAALDLAEEGSTLLEVIEALPGEGRSQTVAAARLQSAVSRGDAAEVIRCLPPVLEFRQSTPQAVHSLVGAVRFLEDRHEEAGLRLRALLRIEEFLLGEDPRNEEQLAGARWGLADGSFEAGDLAQAHRYFALLVGDDLTANTVERLRRYALSCEAVGECSRAIELWRLLKDDAEAESSRWHEAHIHLSRGRARAGERERVLNDLKYYRLTRPTLGGDEWRPQYETLIEELEHEN